ncbi:MAG: rhodanese-like domain-containing protein [Desulfobulbaceae bacterium]|nr:rhodanese-like domain-containing protein [Desulfobulbaceae bacterium]
MQIEDPSALVCIMHYNRVKIIRRLIWLTGLLALLLVSLTAGAADYKFIDPENFKIRLDTNEPTILVDIQKKNAYREHHFYGSIRTFAYPAKTELDTQSLVQAVRIYEQTQNDVVIIGPRGGRACKRTYDFLVTRGIPGEKIYILTGGINHWPYKEMLLDIKGGCD